MRHVIRLPSNERSDARLLLQVCPVLWAWAVAGIAAPGCSVLKLGIGHEGTLGCGSLALGLPWQFPRARARVGVERIGGGPCTSDLVAAAEASRCAASARIWAPGSALRGDLVSWGPWVIWNQPSN